MGIGGCGLVFAGENVPFILSEGTGRIVCVCVFVIIVLLILENLKSPYSAPEELAVASVHADGHYRRHRRDIGRSGIVSLAVRIDMWWIGK